MVAGAGALGRAETHCRGDSGVVVGDVAATVRVVDMVAAKRLCSLLGEKLGTRPDPARPDPARPGPGTLPSVRN